MMKKVLVIVLAIVMVFSFVACSNQKGTTSVPDTSTTTQTESADNTETTDNNTTNESSSDAETPSNSTSTSTDSSKSTTSEKDNTTSSKPSNTTSAPTETSKPATSSTPSTPSTPTKPEATKPVVKPTEKETPYFVSAEIVSIERKYTTMKIDGMNIFDRLFGKNTTVQNGDKITVRVNMSDGSGDGFEECTIETFGYKDYSVNGNLVTVVADGSDTELILCVEAKRKDGSIGSNLVLDLRQYIYSEDMMSDSMYKRLLLRDYATETLGMQWRDGAGFDNNYRFTVWNNTDNWWNVVLKEMDSWKQKGFKYFCLSVVDGNFDSGAE